MQNSSEEVSSSIQSREQKEDGLASLLKKVDDLPAEKRMLLIQKIRNEERKKQREALIPKRSADDEVPLSFGQEQLWLLQQLEPMKSFYNQCFVIYFTGLLNVAALEKSFSYIIARHEILRTTFILQSEGPVQLISAPSSFCLARKELSHLSAEQKTIEIQDLVMQEVHCPFDTTKGPLLRGRVLHLQNDEHMLIFSIHHLIADFWSMSIFFRELAVSYEAFYANTLPVLPLLPFQYADYALWQRRQSASGVDPSLLAYWKKQLAHIPGKLELPTDHPRPLVQTFRGATYTAEVPAGLEQRLRILSRNEGCSLFMTLLAAFHILLARYSGQMDIVTGTLTAGRQRTELEELIGFFVNTLVIRTDLSDNPSFVQMLQRVRRVVLDAYSHQGLSFEQLVASLRPQREPGHSPLFQVMFALQNVPPPLLTLPELTLEFLPVESKTAKFDLTLSIIAERQEGGLLCFWEYSTDLFEASTIRRMAEHFQKLLVGIVADPEGAIAYIPLLPDWEQTLLLQTWNASQVGIMWPNEVVSLLEEQVTHTPEAIALVSQDEQLTYYELHTRANQLAWHLRSLGIGSDQLVAIALHRSPLLLIALLAVLKVGAAFLPLDPSFPRDRLAFLIDDAAPVLLLTEREFSLLLLPLFSSLPYLCLDEQPASWHALPSIPLPLCASAQHLAYVLYTSGSTGRPKGVALSRQALASFLSCMRSTLPLDSSDHWLAVTSLSFDISLLELFLPLLVGAPVHLLSTVQAHDSQLLASLIQHRQATFLQATPATWQALWLAGWRGEPHLHMLCGGETFPQALAQSLAPSLSSQWNLYGPTETTIWSACYRLTGQETEIPLGMPLSNTQFYVLDRFLEPVPIGIAGELYIGGQSLARGYLHQPALTAERFLPHPFSSQPGMRLYRTGDRVCWTLEGSLRFLGRVDRQLKIRGFRIEPSEIEAILVNHRAIREAAIIAQRDSLGYQMLVAYVVLQPGERCTSTDLRLYLQEFLPSYMIPGVFFFLEEMPLTLNGKVDIQALPSGIETRPGMYKPFLAPRTPVEEEIAAIWQSLLGISEVGIYDNFFELGGHSLLMIQLASRIQEAFQIEVPLQQFYLKPTIVALKAIIAAQYLEQETEKRAIHPVDLTPEEQSLLIVDFRKRAADQAKYKRSILSIVQTPHDGELPLSFAQQSLWFLYHLEPDSSFYNLFTALHIQGPLSVAAFKRSLMRIAQRHEILRTAFQVGKQRQAVQRVLPVPSQQLVVIDLQNISKAEIEKRINALALQEAQHPFLLEQTHLLRCTLVRIADNEHILLISMHHIIVDQWSLGILSRELTAFYNSEITQQPYVLPSLPLQYSDYARWQRQWLQGPVLVALLEYWRHQLIDLPTLHLPTDYPYPAVQSFEGMHFTFSLPSALLSDLKILSAQAGTTLFMTMLAIFQLLLSRFCDQTDIVVGSPITNRTNIVLEPLIGLFTNTLVLRTDLSGNPSFLDLLTRVRQTCLDAYAHQDLPFERLVEELQPPRDLSRNPLFQVFFALHNAPFSSLSLPGMTIESLTISTQTTKFDLALELTEHQNQLFAALDYRSDLFTSSTIQQLATLFQTLVRSIVQTPLLPIQCLSLLSPDQQEILLAQFRSPAVALPPNRTLLTLLEEQVSCTPEAIALVSQDEQLTYYELHTRANQLAWHLRSLGIGPDRPVVLVLDHSPLLLIALLAVLKAGGAYLSLDVDLPPERLAFILSESQAILILTQNAMLLHLSHVISLFPFCCLESFFSHISFSPEPPPSHDLCPEHLAYIIYISDSTGLPKGIQVPHAAFVNFLFNMRTILGMAATDRVLAITTPSIDRAVLELLLPLTVGALVQFLPSPLSRAGLPLPAQLDEYAITFMQATPSIWSLLLQGGWSSSSNLLTICSGGEVLPLPLASELHIRCQHLWNLYGFGETTIWSLAQAIAPETMRIALGQPIANVQVYLLDAALHLLPVGIVGEIYLGGVGVARGYVQRPELTAECFVPDPFSYQPGARLYRTGDRARRLPDGSLQFLGRDDQQIKLHGFRIELGEIEAILRRHPAVQEALVLLRSLPEAGSQLIAYLQTQEVPARSLVASVRHHLRQWLPDYMVPARLLFLEELPLLPNGKVDRYAFSLD